MKTLLRLTFLGMVAMAAAQPAEACSCAKQQVCAAFWQADVVFVGTASVTPLGPGAQRARFKVEESFRGSPGNVVEIVGRGFGGSCAYAFDDGVRYLVFARRAPDGVLNAYFCDPTGPVDSAGPSLVFARDVLRNPSRGGRVVGRAVILLPKRNMEEAPFAGGIATLRGEGRVFSTTTGPTGSYQFDHVPPGTYTLMISGLPGVQESGIGVEIKGPGACVFNAVTTRRTPR